jgi:hypothetical protein
MATQEQKQALASFLEGTERTPEHLLAEWTERLRAGERGKKADGLARAVLRDFIVRQWLGLPQSRTTLDWLADALDAIISNESKPLDALGLQPRPKHRPADAGLAIDVALWVAETESRGYTPAEAVQLASEVFHKDAKSIERYRREAREWAQGRVPGADWDEVFSLRKPPRPLPSRRSRK